MSDDQNIDGTNPPNQESSMSSLGDTRTPVTLELSCLGRGKPSTLTAEEPQMKQNSNLTNFNNDGNNDQPVGNRLRNTHDMEENNSRAGYGSQRGRDGNRGGGNGSDSST
ncbi:unnamed protein product [Didymodactylos carnosus]|uniref:Uncharacterized protein n=1 Tax=Didymodactylos carnosus TaxID=1234261 RepID=A0A813ZAV1_9BILA|nr:unnamed protein product [Didymodactylos carnosus]CAF3679312.1 unnamed protein product [Didymodactylos carnosus]